MQALADVANFTSESRAFCNQCDFLKTRCLCDSLKLVDNSTHLIILQHPQETKHPLNTVRIMKKSFKNLSVFTGEDFTHDVRLNEILANAKNSPVLLYPSLDAITLENKINKSTDNQKITHLILIDGTWRKAKKIYLSSMNLQTLAAIKLEDAPETHYKIRKSNLSDSLSTLEASIHTLKIIEKSLDTTSAMEAFTKMIEMQIEKMGREVYQNNYLNKKKE